MLITLFEEKDFSKWCTNDIKEFKNIIIDRAYDLLLSVTDGRKNLKYFPIAKEIIFENLDLVDFFYEKIDDNEKIVNNCLVDRCINLDYDEDTFKNIALEKNIRYEIIKFLFRSLQPFITDSTVIQWKIIKNIAVKTIKVENPRTEYKGYFPISYNTFSFIEAIQDLSGKVVKFSPNYSNTASITRDSILCYFSGDRIETEYLIQLQLFDIYLYYMNFTYVNKYHFNDKRNWIFDEINFKNALRIVFQSQFSMLFLTNNYEIFDNYIIYDILNFKYKENYIINIYQYLCQFIKNKVNCPNCDGIEDVYDAESNCILYKENGIITRKYSINELDSNDKIENIINDITNSIFNK